MNNQTRFPHSVRIEVELDGRTTHVAYSDMLDLHANVIALYGSEVAEMLYYMNQLQTN